FYQFLFRFPLRYRVYYRFPPRNGRARNRSLTSLPPRIGAGAPSHAATRQSGAVGPPSVHTGGDQRFLSGKKALPAAGPGSSFEPRLLRICRSRIGEIYRQNDVAKEGIE